jgi:hypothetical protein
MEVLLYILATAWEASHPASLVALPAGLFYWAVLRADRPADPPAFGRVWGVVTAFFTVVFSLAAFVTKAYRDHGGRI